jgi:hypothetical protein
VCSFVVCLISYAGFRLGWLVYFRLVLFLQFVGAVLFHDGIVVAGHDELGGDDWRRGSIAGPAFVGRTGNGYAALKVQLSVRAKGRHTRDNLVVELGDECEFRGCVVRAFYVGHFCWFLCLVDVLGFARIFVWSSGASRVTPGVFQEA